MRKKFYKKGDKGGRIGVKESKEKAKRDESEEEWEKKKTRK